MKALQESESGKQRIQRTMKHQEWKQARLEEEREPEQPQQEGETAPDGPQPAKQLQK